MTSDKNKYIGSLTSLGKVETGEIVATCMTTNCVRRVSQTCTYM